MEEWSILNDHVKYVMHDESEAFQKLNIDLMNYRQNRDLYKRLNSEEVLKISLHIGKSPEKLKFDYLDVYEGEYTEVISTDRFDEDTNLSTTYLGQVCMTRDTKVKAEESFPMTARGYTKGQLLDGTDCEILIDTDMSKSYMSKSTSHLQLEEFRLAMDSMSVLGIIDLRSLGYNKIKQGVLQQNLSHIYHFESAQEVCDQFNKLINTLRKEERVQSTEKYTWLDDSNERKYMSDREILEKYIDLENSCLAKQEKREVKDLIYKYKDAFSLRDEIGTCPNIEVEIDIMDKNPFYIRPFHTREEDKVLLDKEIKGYVIWVY